MSNENPLTCRVGSACAPDCPTAARMPYLIQEAARIERARAAADEIAFLKSCFADDGPKTPKVRLARITRLASCRLALLVAYGPVRVRRDGGNHPKPAVPDTSASARMSDDAPDFSDFFPENAD